MRAFQRMETLQPSYLFSIPQKCMQVSYSDIQTSVESVEVTNKNVGLALVVNPDRAKDIPTIDGWEIVTDPNGGNNNYVEVVDAFSSSSNITTTWTLRSLGSPGVYSLYLAVQHGSPEGGVAMTGISQETEIIVAEVPENLPRLRTGLNQYKNNR